LGEGFDEDIVGDGCVAGNIGTGLRSDHAGTGDAAGGYAARDH
jgi:hypothetical protein